MAKECFTDCPIYRIISDEGREKMKKEVIPYCPGPGMHQMAIEPHCTAVMGEYGWVEEDSFEKYVDRDREIAYRQYPHEPRIPDRVSKE